MERHAAHQRQSAQQHQPSDDRLRRGLEQWLVGDCGSRVVGAGLKPAPTEKTNAPLTRWPSTVETFFQATVYVPSASGSTDTDIRSGSDGSTALSCLSTRSPSESNTLISLSAGSSGSVNRTVTRSGDSSTTELAAGSDSA